MPTSSELWNQPRYWSPPSRYRSAGQGRFQRSLSTARWLDPESNQTSRMSFSLRNSPPPHLAHVVPGGSSSAADLLVPDVGAMHAEQIDDAVEDRAVGERLAAALAIEDDDRHAPDALARDAPVGPRRDHVGDALLAPRRHPAHLPDRVQRVLAEVVPLHPDEPLLGRAEDHRRCGSASNADRVRELFEPQQRAMRLQDVDDDADSPPRWSSR